MQSNPDMRQALSLPLPPFPYGTCMLPPLPKCVSHPVLTRSQRSEFPQQRKLRERFSVPSLLLSAFSMEASDSDVAFLPFTTQYLAWPPRFGPSQLSGGVKAGVSFRFQSGHLASSEECVVYTPHPRGLFVTFAAQWVLLVGAMLRLPQRKASCRVGAEQGLNDLIRHLGASWHLESVPRET